MILKASETFYYAHLNSNRVMLELTKYLTDLQKYFYP